MSDIVIQQHNACYLKIVADAGIIKEIDQHFKFRVPNYFFMPAYKAKIWDGYYRLLKQNKYLYVGLLNNLIEFAQSRSYTIDYGDINAEASFSVVQAEQFIKSINLPQQYQIRDYQIASFIRCVQKQRAILLSPTASGKTIMLYLLIRYYNCPTLIVVDTTFQTEQMATQMANYGLDVDKYVDIIPQIKPNKVTKPIVITTWQSIYKLDNKWFDRYQLLIGDEAHKFKATSLVTICEKLTKCNNRFGLTGSLDGTVINQLILTGLFGDIFKLTTVQELQQKKYMADLQVNILQLHHNNATKQLANDQLSYAEEYDLIIKSNSRNHFIKNLALSLKGVTLILFRRVDDHGKVLYNILQQDNVDNIPLYYISGETKDKESIRQIVDKQKHCILVASEKTTATAVDIPSINNVILASPAKSSITVTQSIGRGLRVAKNKQMCTVYDIADNLSLNRKENYGIKHLKERIKLYQKTGYRYKSYAIKLS